MRTFAAHDFVPAARARQDGELVAHGARGDEERGFLAEQAGDGFLQLAHGGVFAVHVVAHLGARHRIAHGLGGARHGVRTKVDHARILSPARRAAMSIGVLASACF
jgi:hypothetical protein